MMSVSARLKPVIDNLNRFSAWLLLLALGWLAWTAARLLWLILAPPTAPALQIQSLQNNAASNADNSSLFAIFADPEPVAAAVQPPPNVALKGVLLAIPESLSSALLDVNGEVKNYRIGESLQDSGYTLIAVDWNAVIITDAASKQIVISMADSMPLDQSDMAAGNVSNQRLPDNNSSTNNTLPSTQPMPIPNSTPSDDVADSVNGSAADSNDTGNSNSAIDEAVTALQDSPASYLSRMGVMAAGEGYQVTAAMPAGVRNRLGLEPGDRVLKVNGQSIGSDPTQDAGLLKQVQQSGEAQIEVKRGDQVITIRQQF
ncbi:type II secretion system protein N [Psychrobacter sp. P2G3]|uniref:type II secretion system protein N n=1 Tax=Psychrobacter sp. P2G3 TaxID=1699622 RepID=UPI00078E6F9F|nr:type II secretion system protein N [Psychrobacter sp. P2G3]AMN50292.1 general secretion pathway protein [Psychrobacter sp. P2G3]